MDAKKTLPENVFKQEYLAAFIDSVVVRSSSNLDKNTFAAYPTPIGKVFCGIDLGKQEDYTVATFIDSRGQVVDIYRSNAQEWTTMVTEIVLRIRKWNATTMIEVNSIGDVIFEMVKKQWQDTHPFVTTSQSQSKR